MLKRRSLKRSRQAAKQRRNFKALRYCVGFIAVIGIIWSLSSISWNPFFFIEDVSLEGNVFTSLSDIEPIIFEYTFGAHFGLFSKRNIFLYPKGQIERKILRDFPRIKDVIVRIKGMRAVLVLISERLPEALWCQSKEEKSNCYFLDEKGFIFAESPLFSSQVYTRFLGQLPNDEPLCSVFLPENFFRLSSFVKRVKEIGFSPVFVDVFENNSVVLETNHGKIIFTLERDFDETLGNLKSFWRENQEELLDFEYLDLRFGNKIFYKGF